jgi:hypothetical protein
LLQAAFRGDVVPKGSAEDFQILASKEYGASYALLELAKDLGLDRALLIWPRKRGQAVLNFGYFFDSARGWSHLVGFCYFSTFWSVSIP